MAIQDYLGQKKKGELDVKTLLSGRQAGIMGQLATTKSGIEGSRAQALGPGLQSFIGGATQGAGLEAGPTDTSMIRRKLGANLGVQQAKQGRSMNAERLNQVYEQALNQALDAGYNKTAAENYARQYMNQVINQQNQAWTTNFNIENANKRADMGDNFAKQGVALQDQFQPQDDYQSALIRVLTGLPVQIGSAYLLSKGMGSNTKPMTGQTPAPVASRTPYGPSQKTYGPYNPYETPY